MILPGFRQFHDSQRLPPGLRMIREHAAWLSRVLSSRRPQPRIPVRRVADGGFARLTSTPAGRYRAERWWDALLERLED